ncbi:MAG TPA: aspartate kinase [Polyangiaceae bacterium]|jgi:aspartate kinase
MRILVQKYGGSSVADVDKIGQVADKVVAAKRAGHDVVVVVSAMGKTTDGLLELARSVTRGGQDGQEAAPPRRELDMLVSTGERVTMALLSIAIHARGFDAISFTGSQSGIITNDRHFDARIIEVRPHRIEDELSRGRIVIVAGYQGMSYRREITTLGRGGSDTTAVALAAALGAERCEIYSDVDGVYSADPRVVPECVHLPELDLAMLQEMAEAGAKVLNAQAVEWARRAKIALHARRTSDPLDEGGRPPRETVARERAPSMAGAHEAEGATMARAVVGLDRVVRLRGAAADAEKIAEACAELEIPLLDVLVTGAGAFAGIPLLNVPDWDRRREQLLRQCKGVTLAPGGAIVSVVGDGLTGSAGRPLGRFLAALRRAGVSRAPDALVATPLRIGATLDAEHLAPAQRALHDEFVRQGAGASGLH